MVLNLVHTKPTENINLGKYVYTIVHKVIVCDLDCFEHLLANCISVSEIYFSTLIGLFAIGVFLACFLLCPEFSNCCEIVNNTYIWSSSALSIPQGPVDGKS